MKFTRHFRKFCTSGLIFIAGTPTAPVFAVSMPSTLPLLPRARQAIDQDFEAWLKEYAETPNSVELPLTSFNMLVSKQNPVDSSVMKLYRLKKISEQKIEKRNISSELPLEVRSLWLKEADDVIEQQSGLEPGKRHVLSGTLAALSLSLLKDKNSESAVSLVLADPEYSCTQKARRLEQVKRSLMEKSSSEEIVSMIDVAKSYDSLTHRRILLDAVATNLPVSRRSEFAAAVIEAGGQLPLLMRRHQWLQAAEGDGAQKDYWASSNRLAKKKDCKKATRDFGTVLGSAAAKIAMKDALEAGVSIEQCWKSQSRATAVQFWEGQRIRLVERFGEVGGLWADSRRAYLRFAGDSNEEAVAIYTQILSAAEGKADMKLVQAKAMYMLGKISENMGDFEKAISMYRMYVNKYPEGEDFEYALNSMVVARASKREWTELIPSLKGFLDQQSLVSIDQRPVGNMAFSLFWLGRAYLSLGQPDLAKEMWRRLASEYYSTFYGAMGHFLLEQSGGHIYALEPSRVNGFKMEPLLMSLSTKQKNVVTKTLALLRLGLTDLARCETEELNGEASKDSTDVQLVRSLMLHASGSWLEAIKTFDAIPRSVRGSLPVGFERILFPRRYQDLVALHSAKLGLDPDLAFAVMRQESVFAKEALSPVGAMGLMQLMPATASMELGRLGKNYVNADRRSELHTLLGRQPGLFDPDVNITLGVHHLSRLLELYKSPVFALTSYN
ncbi:MAG: transglycosylase SLT domain-containing protein, partial [Proteobacteria bacterium]|nr:transglycosylase SLT domain-containing protein [Pseudomonadota bacterium]